MINKDILKTIGNKEMDRKDFLKFGGLALAAVVGLKTVVNLLNHDGYKTISDQNKQSKRGFGGGKYGV